MDTVVLLNQDFTFLKVIDFEKAIRLLQKKKVEVVKYADRIIRSAGGMEMTLPKILKLVYYVKNFYKKAVKFNRKNIFLRDGYECAYCGTSGDKVNKLTIDHVFPRSKGGPNTFTNTVTCCTECNGKKRNRTPEEAQMVLRKKVYQPTFYDLMKEKINSIISSL